MNTARLLAWLVLPLVGLVVLGMLAIWLFKALLGLAFYLVAGLLLAGGAVYLYRKVKRALGADTRSRRRIEAASETYRMRNR
jgi:positive regulator of sigma E activity